MDKIDQLLNEVWKVTPKPRKLDEGEYRLFQFSDCKGYAWLDGIVTGGDFAWMLETARMAESALSYASEWVICDSNGVRIAQSKGLTAMLDTSHQTEESEG
jgi:hypothetical protein